MSAHAALAEPAAAAMPQPLSARLRLETRDAHDRIEANPHFARLMAPDLTRQEYRALLARLFGHHAPAEASLAQAMALLPAGLDLPRRLSRTALMAGDLAALGFSPARVAALPRCAGIQLRRREQAWGLLYVLEGSSLGGQVIARHLEALLEIGPGTGAAGMVPHGAATGQLWREFKSMLDQAALDGDAVVDAARQAFDRLDRWVAGG